jgi:hypothetical protein
MARRKWLLYGIYIAIVLWWWALAFSHDTMTHMQLLKSFWREYLVGALAIALVTIFERIGRWGQDG